MPNQLPIPGHFDRSKAGSVWRVDYDGLAGPAEAWAKTHKLRPAAADRVKVCFMTIDTQNTFCVPGFELFVGGRSGNAAVEDSVRIAEFIYRELGVITQIHPTMDTHTTMQIFHPFMFVNDKGEHPSPYSMIKLEDVEKGVWRINPAAAGALKLSYPSLQAYFAHYCRTLESGGKYALTVWPYHAMLGGIGHALVPLVEEAIFFHTLARASQPDPHIKGGNPLTENYSVLRPEVLEDHQGRSIAQANTEFFNTLLGFDVIIIAGQAKSHCVAWTIQDLLDFIVAEKKEPGLANKVYLLEDCTSPVVVPGVIDFTDQANAAFDNFRKAGMHVVRSTDPIASWPDVSL